MVKPITPQEAFESKLTSIPDAIIDATNELIAKGMGLSGEVTIKQDDIVKLACSKDESLTSTIIYKNKWMDIEPIYQKNGWNVSYDSPAWCETYPATFTFKHKKSK